jgi:hypothetical protein
MYMGTLEEVDLSKDRWTVKDDLRIKRVSMERSDGRE